MGGREWGSTLAMTVGLAGLLYFLDPAPGRHGTVHPYVWVLGIGANLVLVGVLVAWGRKGPAGRGGGHDGSSAHQAAVFGVAGGSAFGLTAALMKGMTDQYQHGFGAIFTSWQLYAMVATGALGMFLVQSALNAGRLIAAQPGLTLSDPIISILWGVLAFHERVRGGLFPLLFAALSTVLMAGAVFALARSPLLSEDQPRGSRPGPGARPPTSPPTRPVNRGGSRVGDQDTRYRPEVTMATRQEVQGLLDAGLGYEEAAGGWASRPARRT